MCSDRDLPIWLQRRRAKIKNSEAVVANNHQVEDFNLDTLFGESSLPSSRNVTGNNTSVVPMFRKSSRDNTSDVPMCRDGNERKTSRQVSGKSASLDASGPNTVGHSRQNGVKYKPTVKSLEELVDVNGLDETVMYDLGDKDTLDHKEDLEKGKGRRKIKKNRRTLPTM